MTTEKMKVEIWSDVTCPSCYIAMRKFETALNKFGNKDRVDVIWRSFELAPNFKTNPDVKLPQFLSVLKRVSLEQAHAMCDYVTNDAKKAGLTYNLTKAIPANSITAHQLSHIARQQGLQEKAEEVLMKAYFTDGRNIDDINVLVELAAEIGLDKNLTKSELENNNYLNQVKNDILAAENLGIRAVPHFVFNSTSNLTGVQESELFLTTLEKNYAEWSRQFNTNGKACEIGGVCS